MARDEHFRSWQTDELEGMWRARIRRLLLFEADDAPLRLRRRQEVLCRQARRLLAERGVEKPDVPPG